MELDISYDVSTLSGLPLIKDNALLLGDYFPNPNDTGGFEGGFIGIQELVYDASGTFIDDKTVFWDNGSLAGHDIDLLEFAPQSSLFIHPNLPVCSLNIPLLISPSRY